MMNLADQISIMETFRARAAQKKLETEIGHQEKFLAQEQERVQEEKERREFFEELELASQAQITAFRNTIEEYDVATVRGLMENEQAMEESRKHIDRLLSGAYELPDGRRVFKSTGGQVFDADGQELTRVIDPETIPGGHTGWEEFSAAKVHEVELETQRQQLLEFQQRVDAARETLDAGGVSTDQLSTLAADLEKIMPDAVRADLAGHSSDQLPMPSPNPQSFTRSAAPTLSGPG